MKIIRWLFRHFFLILMFIVVMYGYIYWGNLLGKETPVGKTITYLSSEFVEVKDFVEAVKEKQAAIKQAGINQANNKQTNNKQTEPNQSVDAGNKSLQDHVAVLQKETEGLSSSENKEIVVIDSSPDEIIIAEKDKEPSVKSQEQIAQVETTRVAKSQAATNQAATTQVATTRAQKQATVWQRQIGQGIASLNSQAISQAINGSDKFSKQSHSTSSTSKHGSFVSPRVEKQLNNVDAQGRIIDRSLPFKTVRNDWIKARKAFHYRQYALSEKSYLQVIANSKNNVDAYGELGNVYFFQGKNKQAASVYYEAAAILIRNGQIARAQRLKGLLQRLDNTKAADLQKLIELNQP